MGRLWRLISYADTGWFVVNVLGGVVTLLAPIAVSVSALADKQPGFIIIIAATLAFGIAAFTLLVVGHGLGLVHTRFFPTRDRHGRLFREVFNRHINDREKFWRYYEERYADYRQSNYGIPKTLKELVNKARIPGFVVGQDSIATWIRSNKTGWDESTQQLFKFASSFYPENCASPADEQAHKYRMLQAKFWDRWALNTKHSDRNTYKEVQQAALSNLMGLKLLYFLELALDLQMNKTIAVKSGLYTLFQEIL